MINFACRMTADKMEQRVRRAINETLCYDIHDELPVEETFNCVICLLVLETASRDLSDFQRNLCQIASILRGPGSTLIIALIRRYNDFYTFAGKMYPKFNVEGDTVQRCLSKAGFICMNTSQHEAYYEEGLIEKFVFVSAKLSA